MVAFASPYRVISIFSRQEGLAIDDEVCLEVPVLVLFFGSNLARLPGIFVKRQMSIVDFQ